MWPHAHRLLQKRLQLRHALAQHRTRSGFLQRGRVDLPLVPGRQHPDRHDPGSYGGPAVVDSVTEQHAGLAAHLAQDACDRGGVGLDAVLHGAGGLEELADSKVVEGKVQILERTPRYDPQRILAGELGEEWAGGEEAFSRLEACQTPHALVQFFELLCDLFEGRRVLHALVDDECVRELPVVVGPALGFGVMNVLRCNRRPKVCCGIENRLTERL
mmetsp:Transcript_43625/g.87680  ORF Transcript_43625/g.87680 Transcript_43625/m.87680 type:complete len:216 (+) Transcript_43625:60-707(+)